MMVGGEGASLGNLDAPAKVDRWEAGASCSVKS